MTQEKIEILKDGEMILAEIIRKNTSVEKTTFFSNPKASFQFGFVAHNKGYDEKMHYHKKNEKKIYDVSQVLFVQKGKLAVDFFNKDKKKIKEINLIEGDAINIIDGIHKIRILEDCQCLTVKQGPFISDELDKVEV
tara:strand:+ start:2525 stop:2935 length:411 start_codon:yes stop_codon:yes gene_type:complete